MYFLKIDLKLRHLSCRAQQTTVITNSRYFLFRKKASFPN